MINKKQIGVAAGLVAASAIVIVGLINRSKEPGHIVVQGESDFSYDFQAPESSSEDQPLGNGWDWGGTNAPEDSQAGKLTEPKPEASSASSKAAASKEASSEKPKKTVAGLTVRPRKKEPDASVEARESQPKEGVQGLPDAQQKASSQAGSSQLPDLQGQTGKAGQAGKASSGKTTSSSKADHPGADLKLPDLKVLNGKGSSTAGSQTGSSSGKSSQGSSGTSSGPGPSSAGSSQTGSQNAAGTQLPGSQSPVQQPEAFKQSLLAEKEKEITLDGEKMPSLLAYGLAEQVNRQSAFGRSRLGHNPVALYSQPDQDLQLDLRQDAYARRYLQALPIDGGFMVFDRHILSLNGIDPTRLDRYLQDNAMGGTVSLILVDGEMKDELVGNRSLITAFKETKGGKYLVALQDRKSAEEMNKILKAMGLGEDQVYTPDKVLALAGAKEKLEPVSLAGQADNRKEWLDLKNSFLDNPAEAEWEYNLPLYGHSSKYDAGGRDFRPKKPTAAVSYQFGELDLNQDGFADYILHCQTGAGEQEVEGYWAVFSPSAQGLVMTAFSPYGNGDLCQGSGNRYYFTSLLSRPDEQVFSIDETALPTLTENRRPALQVHFRTPEGLGSRLTGRDLADRYPGTILLTQGQKMYLVSAAEMDAMVDYLTNGMDQLVRYRFQESRAMAPETGKTSLDLSSLQIPDSLEAQSLDSPLAYLADRYGDLPFSYTAWQKAIAVDKLAGYDQVLDEKEVQALQALIP